jgi:hypothetical protein
VAEQHFILTQAQGSAGATATLWAALYNDRAIVQPGDFHHLFVRESICTNMYLGRAFVLFFSFLFFPFYSFFDLPRDAFDLIPRFLQSFLLSGTCSSCIPSIPVLVRQMPNVVLTQWSTIAASSLYEKWHPICTFMPWHNYHARRGPTC